MDHKILLPIFRGTHKILGLGNKKFHVPRIGGIAKYAGPILSDFSPPSPVKVNGPSRKTPCYSFLSKLPWIPMECLEAELADIAFYI